MSQDLDAKPDETPEEETSTPSSEETTPTETATDTTTETDTPEEETEEFDASAFETDYGVPEGTLAGATDEQSALEKIRAYTDRVLAAGLTVPDDASSTSTGDKNVSQKPDSGDKSGGKDKAPSNPELDALRAELNEVKDHFKKQAQAQEQAMYRQLDERITKEIDSWKSPKYGTGKSRNYNQLKAERELRAEINTYVRGKTAAGEPVPMIEKVLKQVRAFHDDTYTPGKKAAGDKQAPLGTPGASKSREGDNAPRSIHHVFMGGK